MKLPEFGFLEKCKIVGKTLLVQVCLFITLLLLAWGSQALYAKLDRTEFPTPVQITDADKLDENAKGKALVDAITHQMRYELNSTFGWSINDILFNRFVLDNRAYRQYGVYHATKVLMDLYSMTIAKLGTNDRESEMLYKARLNSFAIDPRSFMFPSAESSYKKGLKLIEQYKESLDKGTGVYNCRTDDLYASFDLELVCTGKWHRATGTGLHCPEAVRRKGCQNTHRGCGYPASGCCIPPEEQPIGTAWRRFPDRK